MPRRSSLIWLLLVAVLAAFGGTRIGSFGDGSSSFGGAGKAQDGQVLRVVDGDTIHVQVGGRDETVRYIGMDTPESVKPGVPVQCYAETASHDNARMVSGQRVRLVPDREPLDRYGRTLAYVYRRSDGLFVNAQLVRRGDARTLTIPPNTRFEGQLAQLQQTARRAGRGLWGRCGG